MPHGRIAFATQIKDMHSTLAALVIISALATLGVLLVGVVSMVRGGDFNRRNSNKLMRWRVILQGVTLMLLALLFLTH
jgi:threonine/homoserine/homoserine lactone efflux protein